MHREKYRAAAILILISARIVNHVCSLKNTSDTSSITGYKNSGPRFPESMPGTAVSSVKSEDVTVCTPVQNNGLKTGMKVYAVRQVTACPAGWNE